MDGFNCIHAHGLHDRSKVVPHSILTVRDELVFLYKIKEGSSMKSFGIEVARKAGMPQMIIDRARSISSMSTKTNEDTIEPVQTNW